MVCPFWSFSLRYKNLPQSLLASFDSILMVSKQHRQRWVQLFFAWAGRDTGYETAGYETAGRGWAKQKSENSGLFRNLLNGFWLPYSHVQLVLFLWRNFSLNIFCMLFSFDRVHFRISCIIWNRCTEVKSQYWHHQNFSPTSIHCIQKFECLLQEVEFKIMISVSLFVSWNICRK